MTSTDVRALAAEFYFVSSDGTPIACRRWDSRVRPHAVIQIAHGMGEHIGRYQRTIEILTTAGFVVYGNDHRGHGHTARSLQHLGEFGEGGFDLLVDDVWQLTRIARTEYPTLPFFLLGHSMGSFAAQQYVLDHSEYIDGLILSGSGVLDGLARAASSARPANLDLLNAPFEPARTPFDWLCRDQKVVDAFISDDLCFADLSPRSLASFLNAGERLADPGALRCIRPDLPVYLFSGSDDPVGQMTKGVELLAKRYRAAGLRDLRQTLYEGGRHEMLNEINRGEVRVRLFRWMFSVIARTNSNTAIRWLA